MIFYLFIIILFFLIIIYLLLKLLSYSYNYYIKNIQINQYHDKTIFIINNNTINEYKNELKLLLKDYFVGLDCEWVRGV